MASSLITLNLEIPKVEKRSMLENPMTPLSAALLSMGMGSGYTDSNQVVTEQTAIEVPTVLACVRILSEGIGTLPLRVYEELERGRKPAKDHYLYQLLTQEPNPESTAATFFTTLATHAVLWQNAFAEIERGTDGRPTALWIRAPWRTKPTRRNGRLLFTTTDTPNGVERVIEAANMVHIVGFSLDAIQGTSLIRCARQGIGLAMVAAKFGGRFYANGARPGFFLKPDHQLTPEDMTNLRLDLEALSTGSNVFRVGVLPEGIEVVPVTQDPTALSEFVATRKFEREEIAAFFRVPGYMVGATEKALKSTIEAQNLEFLTYSLRPWLERFEQELQRKLLPSLGRSSGKYSIHFYTDAMLSIDQKSLSDILVSQVNANIMTPNEARERQNLLVVPEGDVFLRPLNTQPVPTQIEDVETVDEPAADSAPTATRAKAMFLPVLKDSINRLQHRASKDSDTITRTLRPICEAMGTYFRTSSTVGTAEQEAINKYLKGVEARCSKWTGDPTEDEFNKLTKGLVYAIQTDVADATAKKLLEQ